MDTAVALVERLATACPERIVLSDERARTLTASELWQRIGAVASAMWRSGVRRGERVAIRLPNCIEWSVWEYGAHLLGAVPVGIGMQWADPHARDVVASCGASVLVVESVTALERIEPARLQAFRLICVLDDGDQGDARGSWLTHAALAAPEDTGEPLPRCSPQDAATVIYTSGSTGKPKGILHTHARTMMAVDALAGLYPELEGGRLALSWMPMEHLFQRIFNLVSIAFGIHTRILRDPGELIAKVQELRPTYLAGVPYVYEQLLHAIEREPASFAAWQREVRLMMIGAAPAVTTMLERFVQLGFPIRQAYSTSECLAPIAANTLSDHRVGSVGRPYSAYDFRLSEEGEIRVRGSAVFAGYLGQEELASARFDADGYFRTGDYGYLDRDGYLFVTGRGEDFFKTSTGRRISPFEVESAYKRCDSIEHIVVVGHARKHLLAIVQLHARRAEELAARLGLSELSPEQRCREQRMRDAVLQQMRAHEHELDPYKRVRGILLLPRPLSVEAGELTPTLKLRRDVIVQRFLPQLNELFGSSDPTSGGQNAA